MGRCYLLKLYNMSRVLFYVFALLFVTSAVRSIELSDENLNFLLRLLVKRDNSLDWNNGKCEDQYPACDAALCANENYNVRYKKVYCCKTCDLEAVDVGKKERHPVPISRIVIWNLLMLVIKIEAYSNFFFF